jgi:hypothetical protein
MINVFVTGSGKIRFIYNEKISLDSAGTRKIERFASVEPSTGDSSRWEVSILGDAETFKGQTFTQRSEALQAEELEVVRRLRNE